MEKTRTILVVDDEQLDRTEITGALRAAGYRVLEAENYADAVAVFDSEPAISFLIADIALPDGNGCNLASALQQRNPELGVLFVSGHVGSEACRYYGLEVTDLHFLRKPFVPEVLVERIRGVIASGDLFPDLYIPKTWTSTGD